MDRDTAVSRLAGLIAGARRIVVFTGAGISTECGIPDFRSPGGLWAQNRPIPFQDFIGSRQARVEAWRRVFAMAPVFRAAAPGASHRAVAGLVARGVVAAVVTQNIDGLHRAAGVPERLIVELHGNGTYARCLDCGLRHEIDALEPAFAASGAPPDCAACGGMVKTATISFGQAMPADEMARAEAATRACDLFLALGSSLVVWPAAGLPLLAKRAGARLVILNREETELDALADLVIHDEIGAVLPAAIEGAPVARR